MKVKTTWKLVSTILINLIFQFDIIAQDCDLVTVNNGIRVFECDLEDSKLNAVKADFEIDATLCQYASMVLDIDNYPKWNFEARGVYLVKKISPTELIYYTEVDAPWPIQDRDIVLHLKVLQHPETQRLKVLLQALNGVLPEKDGLVRIKDYWSELHVIPIAEKKSKVEYYLELDPGGDIPAWVVNLICAKIPLNTFVNLIENVNIITSPNTIFPPIQNY